MSFGYKIYFSDRFTNRVICWEPDSGNSQILVGQDPSEKSYLKEPYGIAVDHNGDLLIADKYHHRICRLKNGKLENIPTYDPDGHRKTKFFKRQNSPLSPTGIFAEQSGTFLVSYSDDNTIYRVYPDGKLELVLGIPPSRHYVFRGWTEYFSPEEVPNAPVFMPTGVVGAEDSTIYYIERGYSLVKEFQPKRGIRSLFPLSLAKRFRNRVGPPEETSTDSYFLPAPISLAINRDNLYVADAFHRCVFEIHLPSKQMKLITQTRETPSALVFGQDGTLWILNLGERWVHGFQKTGTSWHRTDTEFSIPDFGFRSVYAGGAGIVCN